jgi:hypothetical protein
MDSIPGANLVIGDGKCWSHKGKYMGKYLSFKLVGRVYDPDPEYTFEHGTVSDLGLKFTEVEASKNIQTNHTAVTDQHCQKAHLDK